MISIYRPRMRPKDRQPSVGDKRGTQQVVEYPAPTDGWNTAVAQSGRPGKTAVVLDNLIPETDGIRPRAGCREMFALESEDELFEALIAFTLKNQTFAATSTSLYLFDETGLASSGSDNPTPAFSGQTSSDYSAVEMQTDGGKFLTLVNGNDEAVLYDGTNWTRLTDDETQAHHVSGVDTKSWSYGWVFQNRQYFIEAGGLNAWYLNVNAVSGVATKLPLSGVFSKSSELLFGASFSTDSGAGIDDYNVFVTKEGEVAIFAGTSPADASNWSLQGLFQIGRPLGKNAHFAVAGDLIIGTVDGLVPLSAVLQKDVSELRLFSLSAAIEPDLDLEIELAAPFEKGRWRMTKSDFHDIGMLVPPRRDQSERDLFVVNLQNKAWCKFTGWEVVDMIVTNDHIFFTDGTRVYEGLVTGKDNGKLIPHHMTTAFDNFGLEGRRKGIHRAKAALLTTTEINLKLSLATNYTVPLPKFPSATDSLDYSSAKWDEARWDQDTWPDYARPKRGQVVETSGYKLCDSVAFQLTFASDSTEALDCKITTLSLAFTPGGVF